MDPLFSRCALLVLACVLVCAVNAHKGCSDECFDYNRICPAVNDRAYYDEYVAHHAAGALSHFSNAPVPPEPDCKEKYYKYACPRSCKECIPCKGVDKAYVQELIAQLEQKQTATDTSFQTVLQQLSQEVTAPDTHTQETLRQLEQRLTAAEDSLQTALNQLDQRLTTSDESLAAALGELKQELTSDDSTVHTALKQLEDRLTAADEELRNAMGDLHQQVTQADSELQATLTAQINTVMDQVDQQPDKCNPCTEEIHDLGNGKVACKPKYHTVFEPQGVCSCECGQGTQELVSKCVTYKERNNGKCVQEDSFAQNCPEGPSTKEEPCNNGACTVTKIVEKTSTAKWSESNNDMRYVAVTKSGLKCTLGVVKQPDNQQREKGSTDTYDQVDIEKPECPDICMAKSEVFEYLEITVAGNDGWKSDFVEVTVNGVSKKYSQPKFLDDKDTLEFTQM